MMRYDAFTLCGILGAGCYVAGYFANLRGWLKSNGRGFPAVNLIGALLVLISLFQAWNLPSVVVEVFWAAISVWGVLRNRRA